MIRAPWQLLCGHGKQLGEPRPPWRAGWRGGGRYSLLCLCLSQKSIANPAMANIVVKTIWQSKEINEAGDTPTGTENRAQGSKEQLGKSSSIKGFPKKKKAVSFHGWELWEGQGWWWSSGPCLGNMLRRVMVYSSRISLWKPCRP